MTASIDDLRWETPRPDALRVRVADDEAGLQDWARMFVAAFEVPEFVVQAWVRATLALGPDRAPWTMMVAEIDGRPVGSCMLLCAGGVAGLIQMGVAPEARRQGVGSAMQLERARLARELRGYRHAVLSAAVMGVSPYTRLGFRDTGARVGRWLWRADGGESHNRAWVAGN